eukprot:TRINITY_DN361_c0_g2_i1.p2 TRINITY_DN361_c0_g2~~TRINITY_DN361_c0_g2_i1.p2  ORF type:complete len:370 (+),score=77.68 TRINITY_DN361_c0_g2_i1:2577-3686(+)
MARRKQSEKVGEHVRIFQRGRSWYANYQFNSKQIRESLETTVKKTALRNALKLDRKIADGATTAPIETATIREAISAYKDYIVAEQRSKKTKTKYWRVLDEALQIATEMGRSSITQIDLAFIDKYRANRSTSCTTITIYHETIILRQLVKFAATRRMTPVDPLAGLKLKRPKPTSQPCFDDEQLAKILAAAKPPHDATFFLLAETGLRIGEAIWLAWADVDFKANVIRVRAKDDWKPKTGDERAIPMSSKLRAFLEARTRRGRWVLTANPTSRYPSSDRQIDARRALSALKRILKPLGIEGKLHTFRHSFISRSLTRGVEESVLRTWVGHVDAEIMRLYTHITSSISQERIKLMDAKKDPGSSVDGGPA